MIAVKKNESQKTVKDVYAKVSKKWKRAYQVYTKINNTTWKPCWLYNWIYGSWGNCSDVCTANSSNPPTQERPYSCKRYNNKNDYNNNVNGTTMPEDYCTYGLGTKGITKRTCNTGLSCYISFTVNSVYDDHHNIGYYTNKNTGAFYTYASTSDYKHNQSITLTKHRSEFPIYFVMHGWNSSHKGGPRDLYVYNSSGVDISGNLTTNPWVNWGHANMLMYFSVHVRSDSNDLYVVRNGTYVGGDFNITRNDFPAVTYNPFNSNWNYAPC